MTNESSQYAESAQDKTSVAWPPFAQKLATVLATLNEDQFLVILAKRSNRFVQFAGQGASGVRAESVSNQYLPRSEQLDAQQIARLKELGWQTPTGTAESSTPERDPDGSPNYFVEFASPVPFAALADLAVRTLVDVLRVPYPGFLEYEAFDADQNSIIHPELGLKRATRTTPKDKRVDVANRLLATVKEATNIADLEFDEDGDIQVRYGSMAAFIRLVGDPPNVRIRSPLLIGVESTTALLSRLNELNAALDHMHFYTHRGSIGAATGVPAAPYVADHVVRTLNEFCQICDGIDELLRAEFGGETLYVEVMPSALKH